jgi:hypothetical protein
MEEYYKNKSIDLIDGEIWESAIFYDGYYEVSNFGRIKSLKRWVQIKSGGRYTKERLMSQALSKVGRLSVMFNVEGVDVTQNVSKLILQSFNRCVIISKNQCVMHKNKRKFDNRLENLIVAEISVSHKINHKMGLLPHLAANNQNKKQKTSELESRMCKHCDIIKPIAQMNPKSFTCLKCKMLKSTAYKNRHGGIS